MNVDDIMRAIDWVGCCPDTPEEAHKIRLKAHKALSALRAENAKLREALKPFAEYAYVFDTLRDGCPDDIKFCSGLTYGDLRAARAAMGETDG